MMILASADYSYSMIDVPIVLGSKKVCSKKVCMFCIFGLLDFLIPYCMRFNFCTFYICNLDLELMQVQDCDD